VCKVGITQGYSPHTLQAREPAVSKLAVNTLKNKKAGHSASVTLVHRLILQR
jgi:hypothetical protein